MTTAALVIAKGKSRRLPDKNILPINGEPMFLVNVKKCKKIFDRVYVSSENNKILKLAEDAGAIPIKRPKKLCGSVPNILVYRHALENMCEDKFVAVQANSPTVDIELITLFRDLMEKEVASEIMTCHPSYKIYGSIWGLTKERVVNYKNPRKPTPDILIKDLSIDCHEHADYLKILEELRS